MVMKRSWDTISEKIDRRGTSRQAILPSLAYHHHASPAAKREDKMTGEMEVRAEGQGLSLLSDDPEQLVKRAAKIANALKPIIDGKKLYSNIGGKKYVRAEGWTTLGAMLGVFPYVARVDRIASEDGEIAFNARVELRTVNGQVISAAEAMCSSTEKNWKGRDTFAIESMAQTRATGKVLRLPMAWIMTLAGYEATPAEEMTTNGEEQAPSPPSENGLVDKKDLQAIAIYEKEHGIIDAQARWLLAEFGLKSHKELRKGKELNAFWNDLKKLVEEKKELEEKGAK